MARVPSAQESALLELCRREAEAGLRALQEVALPHTDGYATPRDQSQTRTRISNETRVQRFHDAASRHSDVVNQRIRAVPGVEFYPNVVEQVQTEFATQAEAATNSATAEDAHQGSVAQQERPTEERLIEDWVMEWEREVEGRMVTNVGIYTNQERHKQQHFRRTFALFACHIDVLVNGHRHVTADWCEVANTRRVEHREEMHGMPNNVVAQCCIM